MSRQGGHPLLVAVEALVDLRRYQRENSIGFERHKLYAEVWTEPATKVAKRYGVSDVGLRKICKRLSVPLPPLGYWARI